MDIMVTSQKIQTNTEGGTPHSEWGLADIKGEEKESDFASKSPTYEEKADHNIRLHFIFLWSFYTHFEKTLIFRPALPTVLSLDDVHTNYPLPLCA